MLPYVPLFHAKSMWGKAARIKSVRPSHGLLTFWENAPLNRMDVAVRPVSKSSASQPGQPPPGVGDVGQAGGKIFSTTFFDDRPEIAEGLFKPNKLTGHQASIVLVLVSLPPALMATFTASSIGSLKGTSIRSRPFS